MAPIVQSLGGTLMAGGVVRGHQSIDAVAGDEGGGISSVALRVNGQPLEAAYRPQCAVARVENPSYAGIVTDVPTPCPPTVEPSWTVDTAAYPFHEGTNSVTVCAQDFSTIGPPNEGCSTGQVTVDNSCTESAVAGGEALSARFQGSGEGQITVPYGSGAEIEGELKNGAGEPVSGATVCVQVQTQESSAPMETTATATTDASGHFAYQLPAGPDRQILLGYRHDSFQVSETITYHADALPQLRLHPNRLHSGGRVHILGSLPGPEAAGRVVVLQASALHGHRWLTFRRATTDQGGGFQASYRFGATTQTTTYRIRAVVPSQRGYPYEPGHSRPGRVKVRARRHRVVKRSRHGHRRSRPPGSGRGRSGAGKHAGQS